MGVEGNYHSNGRYIDTYSTTKAITKTNFPWTVTKWFDGSPLN